MGIVWTLLETEAAGEPVPEVAPGWSLGRYLVGQVVQVRGHDPAAVVPWPGAYLRRWEGPSWPAGRTPLVTPTRAMPAVVDLAALTAREARRSQAFRVAATVQHLGYTTREQSDDLRARSSTGSGPSAVFILIRKSEAWWAMSQDERQSFFLPSKRGAGHTAIGAAYTDRIFRRLYHARYAAPVAPGNEAWDFLTYFELLPQEEGLFRSLLGELRDPLRNPEWAFVDREMEVWTTRQTPP